MKFWKLENGSDRYLGLEDNVPERIIEQLPELIANGLIDTSNEVTYSRTEFLHATQPPEPTWKNTLAKHTGLTDSQELLQLAHKLGYVYFAWNGRIFKVTNYHQDLSYEMVQDVFAEDIK